MNGSTVPTRGDSTAFDEIQQARLAAIVESSNDAIISKTLDGTITTWNPAAERIFGYSAEEVIGQPLLILFPPDREDEEREILARISRGEYVRHFETDRRTKDGTLIDVSVSISPIRDKVGRIVGASSINRDISLQKAMEKEAKLRAAELARSNAELERFAYVASHDLKEPLRAVAGCVRLLKKRYSRKLDERADEFIEHAVQGSQRMQELIDNLLEYARVGKDAPPFTDVDCAEVLEGVLDRMSVVLDEANASVEHEALPTVHGNSTQLGQLFQNLIGNALKFRSDRPPMIRISASADGDKWVFAVSDNGIGIEPQYLDRIFTLYERLHARSHSPGTGLGLAICRKIVEGHGGKIWAESVPGKGSTFSFTLKAGGQE